MRKEHDRGQRYHNIITMVSIPDWTKFTGTVDGIKKADASKLSRKYFQHQQKEAIREAEEQGYFLVPSSDYIVKHLSPYNGQSKNISHICLVRLAGLHLQKLGDIPLCNNLQICILANNFLTRVDALASCQQLIKLDLHGNQLSAIPGPAFWSSLHGLQALYLHDNPLGKFETLQSLASCPKLTVLTLYDSPLCLRKNYRHHVVNSIWTLKALDHHVVSDEEIIEDAVFRSHFIALSPPFRLKLCPASPKDATYDEEMKLLQQLEASINQILARNSPVIIVQRYFRGYMARKKLGLTPQLLPHNKPNKVLQMSPGIVTESLSMLEPQGASLKTQAPSVPGKMESGAAPPPTPIPSTHFLAAGDFLPPAYGYDETPGSPKTILISLTKLQNRIMQTLDSETADGMDPCWLPHLPSIPLAVSRGHRKKEKDAEKPKPPRVKSVKQFFGSVVNTEPEDTELVEKEDLPIILYRLQGHKPTLILSDATTDMILEKLEAGRRVREAEEEWTAKVNARPPVKVMPYRFTTNKQRMFARVYGTMGLSCLLAVQKAYKDREKAEKFTAKMEHIINLREERQRAKERINLYQQEKRSQVLHFRDLDQAKLLDQAEKHELQRLSYLDSKHQKKARSTDVTRSLHADRTFMTEFSFQHTSVSKALLRHDRQAKHNDVHSSQKEKVQGLHSDKLEQHEVVKKYLEHRQLMRQTETALSRAALDTRLLQETTDRLMEAKQRVAHMKAKQATVQALCSLPPTNMAELLAEAGTRIP